MSTKLVFYDLTHEDKLAIKKFFADQSGIELVLIEQSLNEENISNANSADIISVFVSSVINKKSLAAMPKLKMIAARSTGFDNIDTVEAKKRGIKICNVPSYGENTVAEYAFLLLLSITRKLHSTLQAMHASQIEHTKLTGFDLKNRTLGVIGTGRIGAHVIRIARGFEMEVIAYDPYPNQQLAEQLSFKYLSLDELMKKSDIITLHAPYTKQNHHMINAKNLKLAKKGAFLINTARGDLVDTKALVEKLVSGHLGGVGLDVIEGEDLLDVDEEISLLKSSGKKRLNLALELSILEKLPNVIITPHNAFNSIEALDRIRLTTLENINGFLTGSIQNQVS
ncbi:MAG: NAD(P)-dependent oxidoreductase [bacterium]|nr:NAD(P)-dependent oxidoreductase [bacterium]